MKDKRYLLAWYERFLKRMFDFIIALFGLTFLWPIIVVCALVACIDTKANGFFIQKRVGLHGKLFYVIKIRTMKVTNLGTTVTTSNDVRITTTGSFFRKFKLDELPQLINVLLGQMSFVGPRPDVPGYADRLIGIEKGVLNIRPGITGPATIKYKHEEEILSSQSNPIRYNDEIIFPDKVKINLEYIKNWSFIRDIRYIIQTITN